MYNNTQYQYIITFLFFADHIGIQDFPLAFLLLCMPHGAVKTGDSCSLRESYYYYSVTDGRLIERGLDARLALPNGCIISAPPGTTERCTFWKVQRAFRR